MGYATCPATDRERERVPTDSNWIGRPKKSVANLLT
jgi:hypothetical protein